MPNLRFPEFSGEWNLFKIKEILKIKNGKDQKSVESKNGTNPIYGTGGIIGWTDSYLYDKESVCIGRKGTIDKPFYMTKPFWTVDTLFYSEIFKNFDPKFVYFLFQTINWKKYNQSTGVPSLTSSVIENIDIKIPEYYEQVKIADFLNLIEQKIQTQMKIIEEYKKLKNIIMDEILSSNCLIELTLKDIIDKKYARIIKSSELKKFPGTKEYLSTSSINYDTIVKIEQLILYNNRPSRATMYPIENSVWFAKMSNSTKVFISENKIDEKYVLSSGFYGILPNEQFISPYWLKEIFLSKYFEQQKNKFSEGSSMSAIKDSQLSDIYIKIFNNKSDESKSLNLISTISKKLNNLKLTHKYYQDFKNYLLSNLFI